MFGKKKVKIVLPVYNEEKELEINTLKLRNFLVENMAEIKFEIQIADNASTDNTSIIGELLAEKFTDISYLRLTKKGRGRAIKKSWGMGDFDVFAYMDIDLSTDLKYLPVIIKAIGGGFDIAIGSRLLPKSYVAGRTMKREILSRGYNFLINLFFQTHFSDAQCGFKAINKRVVSELLPKIEDNEWFFDSELLIIAEKSGYRIYEEPVIWTDNPGSTVRVLKTVAGDLRGLWRLFLERPWNQSKKMV